MTWNTLVTTGPMCRSSLFRKGLVKKGTLPGRSLIKMRNAFDLSHGPLHTSSVVVYVESLKVPLQWFEPVFLICTTSPVLMPGTLRGEGKAISSPRIPRQPLRAPSDRPNRAPVFSPQVTVSDKNEWLPVVFQTALQRK